MSDHYVQPLRRLIQFCFLGFLIWVVVQFCQFVSHFRSGGVAAFVPRPDGIEGILPISGLVGVTAWMRGLGFTDIHPAAAVLFLTIVAGSFLLRRSFCSWVCPVAAISEWSWKTGFSMWRKNLRLPPWLDVVMRGVKYLLLVFFIYSVAFAMTPDMLREFIRSDYHKIADVRLIDFFLNSSPRALVVLLTLLAVSVLLRNPFCRYLCPYGALLGVVALVSPLRITRNTGRCVSCGACNQVCPSYLDVMHSSSVSSVECIGCWRCISHCRVHGALSMRAVGSIAVPGFVFALLVVLHIWAGSIIGIVTGHWHTVLDKSEYMRLLGK